MDVVKRGSGILVNQQTHQQPSSVAVSLAAADESLQAIPCSTYGEKVAAIERTESLAQLSVEEVSKAKALVHRRAIRSAYPDMNAARFNRYYGAAQVAQQPDFEDFFKVYNAVPDPNPFSWVAKPGPPSKSSKKNQKRKWKRKSAARGVKPVLVEPQMLNSGRNARKRARAEYQSCPEKFDTTTLTVDGAPATHKTLWASFCTSTKCIFCHSRDDVKSNVCAKCNSTQFDFLSGELFPGPRPENVFDIRGKVRIDFTAEAENYVRVIKNEFGIIVHFEDTVFEFDIDAMMTDDLRDEGWRKVHPYLKKWVYAKYLLDYRPDGGKIILGTQDLIKRYTYQQERWACESIAPHAGPGLEDVAQWFSSFAEILSNEAAALSDGFMTLMGRIMTALVTQMQRPIDFIKRATADALRGVIREIIGDVTDALASILAIVIRMAMRCALGYQPAFLLLEMSFEAGAAEYLQSHINAARTFFAAPAGQAAASPMAIILAVVMMALSQLSGRKSDPLKDMSSYITLSEKVVPRSVEDLSTSLPLIGDWFKTDLNETMTIKYPATTEYIRCYPEMQAITNPKPWELRIYRDKFTNMLREMSKMHSEDMQYFSRNFRDQVKQPRWLTTPIPGRRPQPVVYVLGGDSGQGKTTAMNQLLAGMYSWCRALGHIPESVALNEFAYNYLGQTKHMDGYTGQPVVVFNDFLSKKEDIADSVAAALLGMADTAPYVAPMADVSLKGLFVEPLFIIVTTNTPWKRWHERLKAHNNPDAFDRRVTRFYHVVAREVDDRNKIVPDRERGADQYLFFRVWSPLDDIPQVYHPKDADTIFDIALSLKEDVKATLMEDDPTLVRDDRLDSIFVPTKREILEKNYFEEERRLREMDRVEAKVLPQSNVLSTIDSFIFGVPLSIEIVDIVQDVRIGGLSEPVFHPKLKGLPQDIEGLVCLALAEDAESAARRSLYPVPWVDLRRLGHIANSTAEMYGRLSNYRVSHNIDKLNSYYSTVGVKKMAYGALAFVSVIAVTAAYARFRSTLEPQSEWKQLEDGSFKLVHNDGLAKIVIDGQTFVKARYDTPEGPIPFYFLQGMSFPQGLSVKAMRKAQSILTEEDITAAVYGSADTRGSAEMPAIQNSVFEVCRGLDSPRLCYAFALSWEDFLIPCHVLEELKDVIVLKRGVHAWKLDNTGKMAAFTATRFESSDIAHVMIHETRLTGVKDNINRFRTDEVPSTGRVLRIKADEVEEGSLGNMTTTNYHFFGNNYTLKEVYLHGQKGDCGLPYYLAKTNSTQRLLGIHVAGNGHHKSYCGLITQFQISTARKKFGDVSTNYASGPVQPQSVEVQELESYGFGVDGTVDKPTSMPTKSQYVKFKPMCEDRDELWKVEHGLAKLHPFIRGGETIDPVKVRFTKWQKAISRNMHKRYDTDPQVLEHMTEMLASLEIKDFVLSFDESIQSNAEKGLPSMGRGKSIGPSFPGMSKFFGCDLDEERPVLTDLFKNALHDMEQRLLSGKGVPFRKSVSKKDEKLPLAKVESGATRLFAADDIWFYILCRKYFNVLLHLVGVHGRKFGILANMTPLEMGQWFSRYEDWYAVFSDVENMDFSHVVAAWFEYMKIMVDAKIFEVSNTNLEDVHPNLPPLDEVNRIRFYLLKEMCLGYFQYLKYLLLIPGVLGSGCLLTFIFNTFRTVMMFWNAIKDLAAKKNMTLAEFKKAFDGFVVACFGDDSVALFSETFLKLTGFTAEEITNQLSESARAMGYVITAEDKSPNLRMCKLSEGTFCGRRYRRHLVLGPVMALEIPRIRKSVQFIPAGRLFETYPGQVATFCMECALHDEETCMAMIDHLTFGGVLFRDYIDFSYEELSNTWMGNGLAADIQRAAQAWVYDAHSALMEQELGGFEVQPQMDTGESSTSNDIPLEQTSVEAEPSQTEGQTLTKIVESAVVDTSVTTASERTQDDSFLHDTQLSVPNRPVRLEQISWSIDDDDSALLASYLMPSRYFDASANAQMKLANTVGIRYVIRVMLVLNAVAFQAGKVLLTGAAGAEPPGGRYGAMTGPHAILSAGVNQSAQIDIPFTRDTLFSRSDAWSDSADEARWFDIVKVNLIVLSPLRSESLNTANIVVYAQLFDVEAMQGGLTTFTISPQAKSKGRNPNRQVKNEAEEATSGVAAYLHSGLKTVGNIVEGVSNVVSAAAPLLLMAGLSKPTIANNLHSIHAGDLRFMPCADQVDASQSLGLFHLGKNIIEPGAFPNEGDPMEITNITSRTGLLDAFNYAVTTNQNSVLWTTKVTPGSYKANGVDETIIYPTPVNFLCGHFKFWRGTMMYRISLVKTSFHSGTLEVLCDYSGKGLPINSDSRASVLHRVIWDITLQDTLVVEIPFVFDRHVRQFTYEKVRPDTFGEDYLPVLTVRAVTPLIATDTVSDSIEVLVEHWSPDMQVFYPWYSLRIPESTSEFPDNNDSSQASEWSVPSEAEPKNKGPITVEPQMMRSSEAAGNGPFDPGREHELTDLVLLGPSSTRGNPEHVACRNMASEFIPNLRLVFRRFYFLKQLQPSEGDSSVVWRSSDSLPPYLDSLMRLFIWATGGYRVKFFLVDSGSSSGVLRTALHLGGDIGSSTEEDRRVNCAEPIIMGMRTNGDAMVETTIPNFTTLPFYRWTNETRTRLQLHVRPTGSDRYSMYVSTADDFSAGGIQYLPGQLFREDFPPIKWIPALVD